MKETKVLIFLFFILLLVYPATSSGFDVKGSQPSQPNGVFSTFSTGNSGKGVVSLGFEFEQSLDPSYFRISATSSYAFTDYVELSITSPYMLKKYDNGFEDIHFSLKHKFMDEGLYTPSLAYLLSGSPDVEFKRDSLGGRVGGGLILTKKIGPFKTHTNLFFFEPADSKLKAEYDVLLGVDFPATHSVNVLTELVTTKSHFSSNIDHIEGRLGYRYRPVNFFYTTLGVGYEFKQRSPEFRFFLSLTFIYPKKEDERPRIFEYVK
ncbi:MAG: hypothetical protein L3V56_07515 [Candidatus Magnetoovum sp. WYHC-5]|nr:hypothetical protein [Candidatus Magnetoovum sp. WYHC-5]